MTKFLTMCFILIICLGCDKTKDDELSMQRTNFISNELRTDGYYYRYYNQNDVERIIVYILYRNGIIRACGNSESFQDFENKIDILNMSTAKSYKENWGVFIVENDIIRYEKWHGARYLEPRKTYIYAGRILNDTTFHITESYRPNGSEIATLDFIYHFRQFYPKPDSTNNFIK